MFSLCIKFTIESNWRSHVRKFGSFAECVDYINDHWHGWPCDVAYIFQDGKLRAGYYCAPKEAQVCDFGVASSHSTVHHVW